MANLLDSQLVNFHVVGDKTGETYSGNFQCLKRLSHRSQLQKDRIYRELLGVNPENASVSAKDRADILADLQVSFLSVPDWFKESGFGMDLLDDNVIVQLWEEVMKVRVAAVTEVQNKAKAATDELKKIAEEEKKELVK